jgi:predicted HTH domain antitoxin
MLFNIHIVSFNNIHYISGMRLAWKDHELAEEGIQITN